MAAKQGLLLARTLERVQTAASPEAAIAVAANVGSTSPRLGVLPVVLQCSRAEPKNWEPWANYRKRVEPLLDRIRERLENVMGVRAAPLVSGNALQAELSPEQIDALTSPGGPAFDTPELKVEVLELDPFVVLTRMDDVALDLDLAGFRARNNARTGQGVKVAVLDAGIDTHHP